MTADLAQPVRAITAQLNGKPPFALLDPELRADWLAQAQLRRFAPGEEILLEQELPDQMFVVVKGDVRLLVRHPVTTEQLSLAKRGPGQLLGWVGLLRGGSCEWVIASTEVVALALPAAGFVKAVQRSEAFAGFFARLSNLQESYAVVLEALEAEPQKLPGWDERVLELAQQAQVLTVAPAQPLVPPPDVAAWRWWLSTTGLPGHRVGEPVRLGGVLQQRPGFQLPYRLIGCPVPQDEARSPGAASTSLEQLAEIRPTLAADLQQLGILEDDQRGDADRYPLVRARGDLRSAMAAAEMVALHLQVPFRPDAIRKVLEGQFRRDKGLSLELLAGLCELMGLNTQLAEVDTALFNSVEGPAVLLLEGVPVVYYASKNGRAILAHPQLGLIRRTPDQLGELLEERVRFALPRRIASTPHSRFGWSWFTPLLVKYRGALLLVFGASLLAQLFGLAIPLLLQQIIDKVLSQGNLSSLNVLGTAMVVMALFQGVLNALRSYIFVDTTDRMDLTLGSAVIDRMLALPLSYFERRAVGETSQRLGELNTIRGFLTGTALVSVLNLIFAVIYLVVMLLYSPLLTAVALSTFPLYALMVFGLAPIYKSFIRKRAVAQARTQSHLIEVLNGMPTVKAQHFELTARWKWQDRYRHAVQEGFKSVALGTTAGEVGNFLNQVSGLLVLWVGMMMILKGEFTLGQLIAFRIIAGNTTGPLLQLAGLYQGFQGVQLSMERLGDILDQNPEIGSEQNIQQIPLPPIQGDLRFESVWFRFGDHGPYQVEDVSLEIERGSFVGIVGQSGSGKSTLMKLLPKLYDPQKGRIFIDNYDIAKVELSSLRRQIGIVPQDSLLFEGTVAENIALNDPQASAESIIEAATIACAHEFIMGLGQGYATPLAERGSNLSGGQRQRIAVARTILANPQLLIMDEATSALDFDTERQLCLNLQKWAAHRTVLFITHRLSTIRNSDLILVMHQGRLVEQGTHQTLLASNGRYAALYRQQDASAS